MKRMSQIATPEALERFRLYCTRNNPEMADPLFECHLCRDSGYEQVEKKHYDGKSYDMVDACQYCERGKAVRRGRETTKMREEIRKFMRREKYQRYRAILGQITDKLEAGRPLDPGDFKAIAKMEEDD